MCHYTFTLSGMRSILALVLATGALVSSQHQYQPSHQAAILSDARYLAGDGTFGAAYTQEDGVEFKEESDVYGNRRGSYSYVDPNGQRRTVTYTAGKNGFQASGDGIPEPPPQVPPQPEYVPLPQYNPPDYVPPTYTPAPQPTPRPYQPEYEVQPQPRPAYRPQTQPQYRPPPAQPRYQPGPEFQSIPSYSVLQRPEYHQPRPEYQPSLEYQPHAEYQPRPQHNAITTPSPRRFLPPGKLNFNRTPDGFSYTFSKS